VFAQEWTDVLFQHRPKLIEQGHEAIIAGWTGSATAMNLPQFREGMKL
jgi:hypothetical protein